MYTIVNKLKLCGETKTDKDMLEKTYTTFHPSQTILQQQYRMRNFKSYDDLITCLEIAEKHNELLLKNSEKHPIGAQAFPEVNATENQGNGRDRNNYGRGRGRDSGYGSGRGNDRGNGRGYGRGQG